jgi:hypothetical protein
MAAAVQLATPHLLLLLLLLLLRPPAVAVLRCCSAVGWVASQAGKTDGLVLTP